MFRKVLVPVVLLSLGVFSSATFSGCGSDSPKASGTGGKGGASATGGKGGSGTGGAGTGGSDGTGGTGSGGIGTGGSTETGGAGGTLTTGGAGGGTAGADGSHTGGAGGSHTGGSAGSSATGGAGGTAGGGAGGRHTGGAAGGSAGSAAGGAGGSLSWPTTAAACPMPYPGVSPADFCAYYTTSCGETYSAAAGHFASMADCVTKYTAYTATQKGCTAYHLCVAGTPGGATVHCPHPSGGTSNPCNI